MIPMAYYGSFTFSTTHPGIADDGEPDDLPLEIELICTEPMRRGDIWIGEAGSDPQFELQAITYNGRRVTSLHEAEVMFGRDVLGNLITLAEQAAIDSGDFI